MAHKCLFFINSNIFRHLKLEIAIANPASNDENNSKQFNSTRAGLIKHLYYGYFLVMSTNIRRKRHQRKHDQNTLFYHFQNIPARMRMQHEKFQNY